MINHQAPASKQSIRGSNDSRSLNSRLLWPTLALAVMLISTTGCQSSDAIDNDETRSQRWSTRDLSVAGRVGSSSNDDGQRTIPVRLDRTSLRESAIEVLTTAAESTNPMLRANAIEALHHAPDRAPAIVQAALGDPNRGVRFIAAMTVGQLSLCELKPLVRPLLHDEADSVRAAAIYALDRCGDEPDPNPLASMLFSDNPEVRANAALVLGMLGNPSAIPMLRSAVGRELPRVAAERVRIIDLQIAEAIVMLGDDRQLDVIRAALFAPVAEQGEIVALGCQMSGRLGDRRVLPNLHDLATREGRRQMPPEIRLAATEAIARMDAGSAPLEIPLLYADSERFDHRAQAAVTLGVIDHPAAVNTLKQLLTDSNPLVQISAAGGLLQHAARDIQLTGN